MLFLVCIHSFGVILQILMHICGLQAYLRKKVVFEQIKIDLKVLFGEPRNKILV